MNRAQKIHIRPRPGGYRGDRTRRRCEDAKNARDRYVLGSDIEQMDGKSIFLGKFDELHCFSLGYRVRTDAAGTFIPQPIAEKSVALNPLVQRSKEGSFP